MMPEKVVKHFECAWRRGDLEGVYALMTEDILYHNIPREPIEGLDEVKRYVQDYASKFGELVTVDWDVKATASNGDIVFIERISRLRWAGGHEHVCPIVGIFRVVGGRVAVWKDYFDKGTFDG